MAGEAFGGLAPFSPFSLRPRSLALSEEETPSLASLWVLCDLGHLPPRGWSTS